MTRFFAFFFKRPKAQWVTVNAVTYKFTLIIVADATKPLSGDNVLAEHGVDGKRMARKHAASLFAQPWNF